jgi:hypothetical protein
MGAYPIFLLLTKVHNLSYANPLHPLHGEHLLPRGLCNDLRDNKDILPLHQLSESLPTLGLSLVIAFPS